MSKIISEHINITLTKSQLLDKLHLSQNAAEQFNEMIEQVFADDFSISAELRYRVLPVCQIDKQALVLSNNVSFEGDVTDTFCVGDNALLYCVTMREYHGLDIDTEDSLSTIIIDSICNIALGCAVEQFDKLLSSRSIHCSQLIEVGSYGLPISQLKPLIDALDNPVELSSDYYMTPSKTVASIGKLGCTEGSIMHDCARCSAKYCPNRSDNRITVRIIGNNGEDVIQVQQGILLSQLLTDNGYIVNKACNGKGTCGKCAVKITNPLPPNECDIDRLSSHKLSEGYRLCCQYHILQDTTVDMRSIAQIEMTFSLPHISADNFSKNGFFAQYDTGLAVAIDLGTTTVSIHLINTTNGQIIAEKGFVNPQTAYGADVISRVEYSISNCNGLKRLQESIVNAINFEIACLTDKRIGVVAISGNTVMQHIIAGESIKSLGFAPYTPVFTEERVYNGQSLNINCNAVYIVPSISSFVGGDIVSGLVSIESTKHYNMLLDLGTNGEIALFDEQQILVCGTAMGPAFEGVGIECGMSAITGAITQVIPSNDDYILSVIGDNPIGLCGSGIISLANQMVANGTVDSSGKMNCDKYYVFNNVYLSQKDIRQIQLAKGALCAGVLTLLQYKGLSQEDIESVYLSGGFGNNINAEDLAGLSMLPRQLCDKTVRAGNTSAKGCAMILLNNACRIRANTISKNSHFVDLGSSSLFKDLFVEKMFF